MFELSFLNISLLIFSAATILPLLIWLLAKKKPVRVVFPSIRFIKLSKEQEKSRSKLKNILLLIIRMLIILMVTLAVARPMLRSPKIAASKKHPPTAIAILLDTSYSMDYSEGAKSYLQHAKEALLKINNLTTDDDRLILISSDEGWNRLNSQIYSSKLPPSIIDKIRVCYLPLSFEEMLRYAELKLQESQMPNQEMYIISDESLEPMRLKSSVPIAFIPLPDTADYSNLAVTSAKVLPQLVEKKKQQSISFNVENYGSKERRDVLVKAVIGDIKVAEKFVNVPARQAITETIPCEIRDDGWQSGYIEVVDERQTQDNKCYFAFPYYLSPRIGVITQAPSLPPFLSSLIEIYTGKAPQILRPEGLNLSQLDMYQSFILYEPGSLSSKLQQFLSTLNSRKIGLLVCLGNNLGSDMKSQLKAMFGVEIKDFATQAVSIDMISKHHSISSVIADKQIKNRNIASYWKAQAPSGAGIINAQGNPLAIQRDKQSLWLWNIASPNNVFFMDPAFPVFAFRTLDFISGTEQPETSRKLGEIISSSKLVLPGGEMLISPKHKTQLPGVYVLEPGSPQQSMVAVNINYNDSELRRNTPSGVKNLGANWQNKLFMSRLGHDLWKTLLAIAFALVILELVIVKIEESRSQS